MKEQRAEHATMETCIINTPQKIDDIITELTKLSKPDVQCDDEARHCFMTGKRLLKTPDHGLKSKWNEKIKMEPMQYYTSLSRALIKATIAHIAAC